MNTLRAYYPSFLNQKPHIWGISLYDILFLGSILFLCSLIGVGQIPTLILIGSSYLAITVTRTFYPKRHFEFVLISKNSISRKVINEKLSL